MVRLSLSDELHVLKFLRYKRDELGLRTALLTCGSSLSNAFSALAASGILAGLDGKLGFTAWRCEAKSAYSKKQNNADSATSGGSTLWKVL